MKSSLLQNLGIIFLALLAFSSCRNPENEIQETCFDEVRNQGEERVDCGGPNCPPCKADCVDFISNQDEQSPVLNQNVIGIDCGGTICEPCSTCEDGIQNAHWVRDPNLTAADLSRSDVGQSASGVLYRLIMETGIDCGFPCPQVCGPDQTGSDGIQNGDEEGIDCGGSTDNPCPPPTCNDGIQNGTETGIDCGDMPEPSICGVCPDPTCSDGIQNIHIEINDNLFAGYVVVVETGIDCDNNPMTSCPDCPLPTCFDGIQNGSETGIDCGGNCITLCDPEPNCNNGIQDGSETGIDCDNDPNTPCPPCATCTDGIKNGPEFKVDCVDYLIPEYPCQVCVSCHDGLHNDPDDNLFELDIDCGGPTCGPCDQFVTVAAIGTGNGTQFRDQYSYNKILAGLGNTDTLSLDHIAYPGLQVLRKTGFGTPPYLEVTANQGFALDANTTYIRTLILFLPIPESSEETALNIPIELDDLAQPQFPGYQCNPFPGSATAPYIVYKEKLLQNNQADKCFLNYEPLNEGTPDLVFTYNFGGVPHGGYLTKGQIDGGFLRTANDLLTGQTIATGIFTDIEFNLEYAPF